MKSKVITFFGNTFEKVSEGLTDEQLGAAIKLLAAEASGKKVPFTSDKQVYFAYKTLQNSMEYIIHANRREYKQKHNEVVEARVMVN